MFLILEKIMDLLDRTFEEILALSIEKSGKTAEEIRDYLGIKIAIWARIMKGQVHFPMNKLSKFIEICNNPLALEWLAKRCGYDITVAGKKSLQKDIKAQLIFIEKQLNEIKSTLKEV